MNVVKGLVVIAVLLTSLALRAEEPREVEIYRMAKPTRDGYSLLIMSYSQIPQGGGRVIDVRLAKEREGEIVERTPWESGGEAGGAATARGQFDWSYYEGSDGIKIMNDYSSTKSSGAYKKAFRARKIFLKNGELVVFQDTDRGALASGSIAGQKVKGALVNVPALLHPSVGKVLRLEKEFSFGNDVAIDTIVILPSKVETRPVFRPAQGDWMGNHVQSYEGPYSTKELVGNVVFGKWTPDGVEPIYHMRSKQNASKTKIQMMDNAGPNGLELAVGKQSLTLKGPAGEEINIGFVQESAEKAPSVNSVHRYALAEEELTETAYNSTPRNVRLSPQIMPVRTCVDFFKR